VDLGYEVFGHADPTVLLMPTWTIVNARLWKLQVPHLARSFRVVAYDGPGNGASDRVSDPARYTAESYAADASAVLDACGVGQAVVVGLSLGAQYGARLAALRPDVVRGLVLVAPTLPLLPPTAAAELVAARFREPAPEQPRGWERFNLAYWHAHYPEFAQWFFAQALSEPHSTKAREDAVGWALETGPQMLEAEAGKPARLTAENVFDGVGCPVLVVHGTDDRITPHAVGAEAARRTGGTLVTFEGAGHLPNLRDPVPFNRVVADFAARVTGAGGRAESARAWVRGASRATKVLFLSSPIGLGHVRRDLAIAGELRTLRPDVEIDWLAQDPVTSVLAAAGERLHPASGWLASESGHIAAEASGHDLHCFRALRRMDEILLANFMVFQEVVEEGLYDLVVGDEAWDVDHYWHENPELKRGAHVWLTDFVGYLPMPDGGRPEADLTADYNAEMIERIARYPRIRDRAVFVGNPDDVVPGTFGPGLPAIRDWTGAHFDFSGYVTGFTPPTDEQRAQWRADLGYHDDEQVCLVSVGGSGVGRDLLEKAVAAYPIARKQSAGLRMVVVAGPRIDPAGLAAPPGLDVRGYVDQLYRHLAVCDLAVVQGGLTTTMELAAAKRPFLYFPLAHHFEQTFHVRHRLDRYGAGTAMDYDATDPDALAAAITSTLGAAVRTRDVETDGAQRAAALIAELL
jgi:pimeloyl-ACP methyl ester carboxylesterase/predicted glycosyltransferase